MNRERAKELLPIIEAFANGEDIQTIHHIDKNPEWQDSENLDFGSLCEYRIKPKLREFWLDLTNNEFIEADKGSKYWGEEHGLIKVREILNTT